MKEVILDFVLSQSKKIYDLLKKLWDLRINTKIWQKYDQMKFLYDKYKCTKKLIRLKKKVNDRKISENMFDISLKKYCVKLQELMSAIYASTNCVEQRNLLCDIIEDLDSPNNFGKIYFIKWYCLFKRYAKNKDDYEMFYKSIPMVVKPLYDVLTMEQKLEFKSKISVSKSR